MFIVKKQEARSQKSAIPSFSKGGLGRIIRLRGIIAFIYFLSISMSLVAEDPSFWKIIKNEQGMTVKTARVDVVERSPDGAWEIKTKAGTVITLDKSSKLLSTKGTQVKTAQRDLKMYLSDGKERIIPKGRILTFVNGYLRSVK